MERDTLRRLELLNQLRLTDTQKEDVLSFFAKRDAEFLKLDKIDTSAVERMVHVMPIMTVVREDKVSQPFSRDDLQKQAPS